jgi:hypothetical protein
VAARFVHNDRLVDALNAQAFTALTASPGARACYEALRDRGISHNDALRTIANRLVLRPPPHAGIWRDATADRRGVGQEPSALGGQPARLLPQAVQHRRRARGQDHARQHCGANGDDGNRVHVERAADVRRGELGGRPERFYGRGVVNQDVDRAAGQGGVDRRPPLLVIGDVGLDNKWLSRAGCGQLGGGVGELIAGAGEQDQPDADGAEPEVEGAADAAPRAGDQCGLAGEFGCHGGSRAFR